MGCDESFPSKCLLFGFSSAASIAFFLRTQLEFHGKSNKEHNWSKTIPWNASGTDRDVDKLPLLQPFLPWNPAKAPKARK